MVRTRLYRDGILVREDFPIRDISAHLADPTSVVWLDLYGPGPAEFAAVGQEFGLHELALEDARHKGQRPKVDRYQTHEFLSAYAVTVAPDTAELSTSEVAVFLTDRALITLRLDDGFAVEDLVAHWDQTPGLAGCGVGFLVHGLLDLLVDGQVAAVQHLDDQIEELEGLLFDQGRRQIEAVQRRSYALRKSLTQLRRVVLPMRDVVNTLMRPDLQLVAGPLVPYYQDVQDHLLHAIEQIESLRDMVASVMETNMSVQANQMNLIMKKVTSWAAIIAVPTAITGFYGQNLPYPGFAHLSGLVVSSALIAVMSTLLYLVFKHKNWL
jgi:magnesium transporter